MGGEEEEGDDEEEDDDMPALEGEDEEGEKAESSSKAKIEEVNQISSGSTDVGLVFGTVFQRSQKSQKDGIQEPRLMGQFANLHPRCDILSRIKSKPLLANFHYLYPALLLVSAWTIQLFR